MNPPETPTQELPPTIREVLLGERRIYLLGTAHVSRESIQDVRTAFERLQPETVCVELCPARMKAMENPEAWKQTNIFNIIREGRAPFLLAQMVLTGFYRRIADHLETQPGGEMVEAVTLARSGEKHLVLADRDVQVTLKRVWGNLTLWQKTKLLFHLLQSPFEVDTVESSMVEEMKEWDQLEGLLETFGKDLPGAKHRLIDERDLYLAEKIRRAPGNCILAVVGAGHVPGISKAIHESRDLASLETLPPPSRFLAGLKWGIPLLILALFGYGFFKGGTAQSVELVGIWVLVNGLLSALGVAFARGHPVTILTAFVAAPLTSLNPMIAAGWVAGLVQAWIKKPTVADFEDLSEQLTSFAGFWNNKLVRVLLVVVLANLGSAAGTYIAGYLIARRIF